MPVDHLFLAPHFDDVALSCGGEVARVVSMGRPAALVTVFAGTPTPEMPLTPYARWHLTEWGVASVAEALETRRAEDRAAAAVLGASPVMLPFVDGPFREDRYHSWDELRTRLAPADASLPADIADALLASGAIGPATHVSGPMAIGRHVDHQAIYAAIRLLAARGVHVRCYEDYPYAADEEEYRARMAAPDLAGARADIVDVAPWLEMKVRAIGCYVSQPHSLFPDAPMAEAVRAYGNLVAGGRGVAERFWWPDGESG